MGSGPLPLGKVGSGFGVAVAVGVGVGVAVCVGVGVGVGDGLGSTVGEDVEVGAGVGDGAELGSSDGTAVGLAVGVPVGVGVGVGGGSVPPVELSDTPAKWNVTGTRPASAGTANRSAARPNLSNLVHVGRRSQRAAGWLARPRRSATPSARSASGWSREP